MQILVIIILTIMLIDFDISVANFIKNSIIEDLKRTDFSLMIDEMTDITRKKYLSMFAIFN